MNNKKIFIQGSITKAGDNKYRFIASTSSVDRQGDSIDQNGWILDNFKNNPVILWAHRYDELPVGKAINIEVIKGELVFDMVFATHEKAKEVKKLVDDGMLNTTSVGFMALERNGHIITRAELLEISIVPVPANQDALAQRAMLDSVKKDIEESLKEEEVVEIVEEVVVEVVEEVTTEEVVEVETPEIETKAGKVISKETRKALENSMEALKSAVLEIEKLLEIDVATPNKNADDVESKYVTISRDVFESIKFTLRTDNKQKDFLLSALKQVK